MTTFADLMREVGLQSAVGQLAQTQGIQRPRPLPRRMRPPEERVNDPRLAQSERTRAFNQFQSDAQMQQHAARVPELWSPPSNKFAEAGNEVWEMTGVPAAGRAGDAMRAGDTHTMAMEGFSALLGLSGLVGGLHASPRAAPRPRMPTEAPRPMMEPPALPRRPAAEAQAEPPPDAGAVPREQTGALPARSDAPGRALDRLLSEPNARLQHGETADIHQTEFAGRPLTMYDFKESPALTNVRFQPLPDGQTFTVVMSARGVEAGSPMSTKAQVFADSIAAIEHHAAQNNAAQRGLRYLFTGETDAHTRLFRGIAERATWPKGAVIHDTPAGFEVSFAPTREPFSGELPFNGFAHQPRYNPNLGQEGVLRLSEAINNRTRQIAVGEAPRQLPNASKPPDGGGKANTKSRPDRAAFSFTDRPRSPPRIGRR